MSVLWDGALCHSTQSPDLDTAAAMADNAESCCLAVPSRPCRPWASCRSASGDRVGVFCRGCTEGCPNANERPTLP
jgi:hypothetical protein